MPFQADRVGQGGIWGDLVVEEFAPQPPTEMATPAADHHQINVSFSQEWARREWSGQSRSGIFSKNEVAVIAAEESVSWVCPHGSAHCLHIHLPRRAIALVHERDIELAPARAPLTSTLGCQDDTILRLAFLLYDELRAPKWGMKLFIDTLTLQLAIALVRRQMAAIGEGVGSGTADMPADIARVIDYIDAYLGTTMSVTDLAAICELPEMQFLRRFKRVTGLPPHRFVIRRRAQRAAEILRHDTEGLPLSILALELGFCDQTHFTKVFKANHGVTPARYRKAARSYYPGTALDP